jgi:hypothetical protein
MKNNWLTNILLIIVAILLIANLWFTLSVQRYHIVYKDLNFYRIDKLTGTYEHVKSKEWKEKNP